MTYTQQPGSFNIATTAYPTFPSSYQFVLFNVWMLIDAVTGWQMNYINIGADAGFTGIQISITGDNTDTPSLSVQFGNDTIIGGSFPSEIINFAGLPTTFPTWSHWLMSLDLVNGVFQLYVNDVSISLDSTTPSPYIGAFGAGPNVARSPVGVANIAFFGGSEISCQGDIYLGFPAGFYDLTVESNRDAFSLDGQPVFLGNNGELPTGSSPMLFFTSNNNVVSDLLINAGSGGGTFALDGVGSPAFCGTTPSDVTATGTIVETGDAVDHVNFAPSIFVGAVSETGHAVDTTNGSDIHPSSSFAMGNLRVIEVGVANAPEEFFVPVPFAKDYAMVWMNGFTLSPDFNYEIPVRHVGWDAWPWDSNPFDLTIFTGLLEIFNPINGVIVATVATAQAAREQIMWKVVTNTPAFLRMPPALHDGIQLQGMAKHDPSGTFPLYRIRYEYLAQSPFFAGVLTEPLAPTDTSITIQLFLKNKSWKLLDPNPLANPSSRLEFENYQENHTTLAPNVPGVIWINGERIEYFKLTRSGSAPVGAPSDYPGNMVTLTGLRRGTRGTTIAEQRTVSTGIGEGVPQLFTLDTTNGTGPLEVRVDGKPLTDYTVEVLEFEIAVTLLAPFDSYITVAMTNGFTYMAGTQVYNGSNQFYDAVPVGIRGGDREIAPLNQLTSN